MFLKIAKIPILRNLTIYAIFVMTTRSSEKTAKLAALVRAKERTV